MNAILKGWICRTWIETYSGWLSEFERFDTEEEANDFGISHNRNIRCGELARDFEIYKDYYNPEYGV